MNSLEMVGLILGILVVVALVAAGINALVTEGIAGFSF